MTQKCRVSHLTGLTLMIAITSGASGCSDEAGTLIENTEEGPTEVLSGSAEGINFDNILAGSILGDVAEVDCTLSNGAQSRCYQFEVIGEPLDHEPGPYCPRSITDGPNSAGKWLDNGLLVDLDGAYIVGLEDRYGPGWLLYDEQTGLANVTDTPESCLAAAQLNPPQEWWNHCIECTI
jgi:hypothetical protein